MDKQPCKKQHTYLPDRKPGYAMDIQKCPDEVEEGLGSKSSRMTSKGYLNITLQCMVSVDQNTGKPQVEVHSLDRSDRMG